ncbi:MAG: hypothetical protein V2A69_15535 [Pseudomonadota bacterium]
MIISRKRWSFFRTIFMFGAKRRNTTMKPGSFLAMVLLTVIAIAHLLRLVFRVEVTAGGVAIPLWVSMIACVGPALIAVLLWRESHRL